MLIVIEREKLYKEVWSIKMKDLAKNYNVSEASLRKYCRKLNVPFPQSGYWIKVRNGSNPKKLTYLNLMEKIKYLYKNVNIEKIILITGIID